MSTRIGTLQAPGAGGSILLATFLVSLVMLTVAVVGVSFDRDQVGQAATTTFVGRHMVNTPSELSAGTVGGAEQTFVGSTAANTPSELNAQIRGGRTGIVPGGTLANTPTELSGGVIGDGLPADLYDRHQRG
jgi:hypothetical protein